MPISDYSFGATVSTLPDRFNSSFDKNLELRDYGAAALSADTSGTAITPFYAEKYDQFKVIVFWAAIGGTVDGSNYWNVIIEADNESGFTSPVVLGSYILPATAGRYAIPVTGEQAYQLRVAASMTTQLDRIRVRFDKVGTTAGNLTVGVYISDDC